MYDVQPWSSELHSPFRDMFCPRTMCEGALLEMYGPCPFLSARWLRRTLLIWPGDLDEICGAALIPFNFH